MHILLTPSWYPSKENAIRGVFFREQAAALQKAGHKVGVLYQEPHPRREASRKGFFPSIAVETEDNFPVYRVRQVRLAPPDTAVYIQLLRVLELIAYRRYQREQGQPDILHAHSVLYGGYLAGEIKIKEAIPVVMTEHSTAYQRRILTRQQERTIRAALRKTDAIIAVGQTLADAIQPLAPGKMIHVVGNMVDEVFFHSSPPISSLTDPFTFVSAALLTERKGMDILLTAFSQLKIKRETRLKIAGNGPELQKLRQMSVDLGLGGRVEFLGAASREQTRALLQSSHCLISPSYVETFGVTLIEALACGKPVIATRSGGPQDILNGANGLLVPVGDVAALTGAMETLIATYDRYDPEIIRADCRARFSAQAIVSQLEQIYRSLV